MKKIIFLMVFVSMISLSPAYADEEIQLAAVMSASDIQVNKRVYATDVNRLSASSNKQDYEFGIVAGIVIAATIAIVAQGYSTTSH